MFQAGTSAPVLSPSNVLARAPAIVFWVWINLLCFVIDNQRQPESIGEDLLNKPWRPLPSRRLSPSIVTCLMLSLYPVAAIVSYWHGNLTQCLCLAFLGFSYNDLHGADISCLTRNLINACGFIYFYFGALQVMLGGPELSVFRYLGWWWLAVIALVVFSTVHTQDMYDQRGDAKRNRRTVPLVIGDAPARWTIALPMVVWC